MRIAYIGLRGVPAAYSGVERAVEEIGCRLAARGHDITVYCMANRATARPSSYRGMKLEYVRALGTKNLEMITYAISATLSALVSGFDMVHFHALGPATLSLLPRLFGGKTIVTVHGLDWKRAKWGRAARAYLQLGELASSRCPNATIVVSEVLRGYYDAKYRMHSVYIPNGVPAPPAVAVRATQREDPNGAVRDLAAGEYVIFVGRLTPEKNVHQLIRAFRTLRTDKKLVIVGGAGPRDGYGDELAALAALDSRVILAGSCYGDTVNTLLSNAWLFVLPSSIEGLPIALIEALACGVPSLVSDIPENLEVIGTSGVPAGYTFQAGNEAALGKAMAALLAQPAGMAQVGARGTVVVRAKYNWDAITTSTETLYRRMTRSAA